MKKRLSTLITFLLIAMFAVTSCLHVFAEEAPAAEDLDYVELDWYVELSPVRPDFDMFTCMRPRNMRRRYRT